MTSKVDIANMALDILDALPITSFEDGTASSNRVNRHYTQVVDDVLTSNNWTNAVLRQSLSRLSEAPVNGFANQFTLPTDPYCLKVIDAELSFRGQEFKVENGKLLTDAADATIKYISRIENSELFGPNITRCVIALLAQRMAYAITGSQSRSDALADEYDFIWADSTANDGMQGSPDEIRADDLIDVR